MSCCPRRLTKITYPDLTSEEFFYANLDQVLVRDRAGRETSFEYNSLRQMTKRIDPLKRTTYFRWCKCGALKTLTDPMGRTTTWRHDLQGRVKCKEYADGSKISYLYENTTSRPRQRIDEKLQITQYSYNRDNTLSSTAYTNPVVPTPTVGLIYDPNYNRLVSMTDGIGATRYAYFSITPVPSVGAGQLASIDGPLEEDTISFGYDSLGRPVSTAINGTTATATLDALGRVTSAINASGSFNYTSSRIFRAKSFSKTYPNGQQAEYQYGDVSRDKRLQRITHSNGATPISAFIYEHNVPTGRIITWDSAGWNASASHLQPGLR